MLLYYQIFPMCPTVLFFNSCFNAYLYNMTSKPLYPSKNLSHYFLIKVLYLGQDSLLSFSSNKLPIVTEHVPGLVLGMQG